jgi:hypothetical protein
MKKPIGHRSNERRPHKGVPDDLVSCPPALNLMKTSVRRTKRLFVNELIEMSPKLAEIEERSRETDCSEVESAWIQSEVSSLGTADMDMTAVSAKRPMKDSLAEKQKEKEKQRQYKTSRDRVPSPSRPPRDRSQHTHTINDPAKQRSNRASLSQHNHNPSTRPRNYQGRRQSSIHSSVPSSMNSSLTSWDTMSHSVYSVYTTASTIARKPAWGHYILGLMVFVGWMIHHWYFSEYFVPYYEHEHDRPQRLENLVINVNSNAKPSMLRGAVRDAAVYKTQDYENRNDFQPIKSAATFFETIEGERPIVKAEDLSNYETEVVLELPPPPVKKEQDAEAKPEMDEKEALLSWTAPAEEKTETTVEEPAKAEGKPETDEKEALISWPAPAEEKTKTTVEEPAKDGAKPEMDEKEALLPLAAGAEEKTETTVEQPAKDGAKPEMNEKEALLSWTAPAEEKPETAVEEPAKAEAKTDEPKSKPEMDETEAVQAWLPVQR